MGKPTHHHAIGRIETASRLVHDDRPQRRTELIEWNDDKPEPRVDWHVPRNVAKGRNRDVVRNVSGEQLARGKLDRRESRDVLVPRQRDDILASGDRRVRSR